MLDAGDDQAFGALVELAKASGPSGFVALDLATEQHLSDCRIAAAAASQPEVSAAD